jgi:deoxyribodipyrimidine photolyase-related protein
MGTTPQVATANRKSKSLFRRRLQEYASDPKKRVWVFIAYDQLNDQIGPLADRDPSEIGIILIENRWKARQRPYHKQKLALVLANLRHFALEQAKRGVAIRHVTGDAPYREILASEVAKFGPVMVMRPAEYELRVDLAPLIELGGLREIPHNGWLTSREQFINSQSASRWRMDSFYRFVRRETGILMAGGKPLGGKFSYDPANRLPWKGDPPAAVPPEFRPDEITAEVLGLVERDFSQHPGQLKPENLAATHADAERLWQWAQRECLPHFGPFEDAMSQSSRTIFHSRISALLNLHRLLPSRVIRDVEEMEIPLASKEGFIRQILGWREFMHHVHEATDGFHKIGSKAIPTADQPDDGGFSRWTRAKSTAASTKEKRPAEVAKVSRPKNELPLAYWGDPSGLNCLDTVVREVWEDAYGHHITRLMVLSNIATLLEVSPRELTDWFWIAYADAYDWVVEPNVLGMGTFALGDLFTTKPYISGASYINRMSDYCGGCAFDPKKNCPLIRLYWAFLERHQDEFGANIRMAMPYRNLMRRKPSDKKKDREVFEWAVRTLRAGKNLSDDPGSRS